MKPAGTAPQLAVIIPTLNEAAALPLLLADLGAQSGVAFEVVISDGGSTDGTPDLAAAALARCALAGRVVSGPPGRGRQLNRGAAETRADWLLFLHADSRLGEPTALAVGLSRLTAEPYGTVAGHCTLTFDLPAGERDFGYYLAELKARLGFSATIHGDQGLWVPRALYARAGGFREDLPVLEDTLLVEALRPLVAWRRLPVRLATSPRRFRSEGFRERQLLNALLVNFAMIGWMTPLQTLPGLYREQRRSGPLDPVPFFLRLDELLAALPLRERLGLWYRTGAFVRDNAWQLPLRRRARRAFAAGLPIDGVDLAGVRCGRRWLQRFLGHPVGSLAAMILTWLWFRTRPRQFSPGGPS